MTMYIFFRFVSFLFVIISLMRCLNESLSYIWRFSRLVRFRSKSQRRTMRRWNFENSRGELSSRRLVSSRRYLWDMGAPSSSDVISFPRFPPHRRRSARRDKGTRRERRRRRGGSASRITRATKLPLRRQVRGRLGRCSKSHYPRIIVFNSFSRRIISRGLIRPPIRLFVFFPHPQNRRTAPILRSLLSSLDPEENFSGAWGNDWQLRKRRQPIDRQTWSSSAIDVRLRL